MSCSFLPGGRLAPFVLTAAALVTALAGCVRPAPDADVVVIGAGLAGLAAALEASERGARVLVVEANSVGGGHAVKAGGFALVGTPLQEASGYQDDPETAIADLLAWGEDADPVWVRRYVEASRSEVHDWLGRFGIVFTFILDTPQHSVPRFHFARGGALNVVLPLLNEALGRPNIRFLWHTQAVDLLLERNAVAGVKVTDLQAGTRQDLRAPAVIVATGGFQANLDLVRQSWSSGRPNPDRLYVGAGNFADGSGLELARRGGAAVTRMDHQVTFTTGRPDPRDATGRRALLTQNPAAIWVNARGERFINENGPSKVADETVLGLEPPTHWLIFDRRGARGLRIRDAVWLGRRAGSELAADGTLVESAATLAELAGRTGLPADALEQTVSRYNIMVAGGEDKDFGRFSPDRPDPAGLPIREPPFYAVQLFPFTRKSMGGLRVDTDTRVLNEAGEPIPGLYAAGEVTGVAGINGSHGGEGTFLGPSVFMGRLAGTASTAALRRATPPETGGPRPTLAPLRPPGDPGYRARSVTLDPEALPALIATPRPGYWHFEVAHQIVIERGFNCLNCHSPDWPTAPAVTPAERQSQLRSCARCH